MKIAKQSLNFEWLKHMKFEKKMAIPSRDFVI